MRQVSPDGFEYEFEHYAYHSRSKPTDRKQYTQRFISQKTTLINAGGFPMLDLLFHVVVIRGFSKKSSTFVRQTREA
jgi:hypothetical protein